MEEKRPPLPDISISAVQGMFLHMLAKSAPSQTLIEVGALGGYSAAWLASAIDGRASPSCVLHTIERDADRAALVRHSLAAAGLGSVVNVLNEPALDAIPRLCQSMQRDSVGLVFLDAQKSEYTSYFQLLEEFVAPVRTARRALQLAQFELIIRFIPGMQGGWVVADNCLGTRRVWIDMTGSIYKRRVRARDAKLGRGRQPSPHAQLQRLHDETAPQMGCSVRSNAKTLTLPPRAR
jgi:hypothetical protein